MGPGSRKDESWDILSELLVCSPRPYPGAWGVGYLALLGSTIAAGLRALLASNSEPIRPNAPVWAVAFTPVERDVLSEVEAASAGEVVLIDAENPLALWSRKEYATARFRAGCSLVSQSGTSLGQKLVRWGARAREATAALAELELHARGPIPQAIILANQFSPRQKALLSAFSLRGVRSVYVQHAAIGGFEGPLIVDCAVLQGFDSVRKYLAQGPAPLELVLGGAIKVEAARGLRTTGSSAAVIGLCPDIGLNPEDCGAKVIGDAQRLAAETGATSVQIRPHPTDSFFEAWRAAAVAAGVKFSDSRVVPTQSFLASLKGLVVGDSNLVVEALALGVEVRPLDGSGLPRSDQYGMIAAGVLDPMRRRSALGRFVHMPKRDPGRLARVVARLGLAPVEAAAGTNARKFRLANAVNLWLL